MRKPLLLLSCATLVLGCASSEKLTLTGPTLPSRGEHCDFQVFSVPPADGFVEVGTIDDIPRYTTVLGYFKERIEPLVCGAGGDAAIARKNGSGHYIQAVVLKAVGGLPSSKASQPDAVDGCRYDTQCKGERICEKGSCVDPVKR